jgi:hypothetical protein
MPLEIELAEKIQNMDQFEIETILSWLKSEHPEVFEELEEEIEDF